jgi:hypothetical protein
MVGKNDLLGRIVEGAVSFLVLGEGGVDGCEVCDALKCPEQLGGLGEVELGTNGIGGYGLQPLTQDAEERRLGGRDRPSRGITTQQTD